MITRHKGKKCVPCALAAALLLGSGVAHAQTAAPSAAQAYPVKPLRLLVGFIPGTTTDIIARTYANKRSESMGHQVVVENRAVAGANSAAETMAKSAPDGYTLLLGSTGLAVSRARYSKLNYQALRERLAALGADTVVSSLEAYSAFLKSETEKYGKIVHALGLRAD